MRLFNLKNKGARPGAINSTELSPETIQTRMVKISSAQILALNTTPIELVPAPGTGYMNYFLDLLLYIQQGGTDYATAHTTTVKYTDASGTTVSTSFTSPFILSSTTVSKVCTIKQIVTDLSLTDVATWSNKKLVLSGSADPITGNHTALATVRYCVLPVPGKF